MLSASAFYLPGVAPHDFEEGEKVELKVNKLSSSKTQVPFDYYRAKYCQPKGGAKLAAENLGEFLTGDRIETSPYQLFMRQDEYCKVLCQVTLTAADVKEFRMLINEGYHHNWIIDNLPAASVIDTDQYITTSYSRGFPVGYSKTKPGAASETPPTQYVYNHVNLIVKYHEVAEDANRVVGFYVEPFSVRHMFVNSMRWDGDFSTLPPLSTCSKSEPMDLESIYEERVLEPGRLIYTYDVIWKASNTKWASRWDIYLSMDNAVPDKVHWFSIVNSVLIVVFLTAMVGMILLRNLRRDIARYNRIPTDEEKAEEREESGWKLVHADVFRPPATATMLYCVCIGTGVQLLCMSLITVIFAAVGFLSPANRGSLMIAVLLLYVIMGSFAGYSAANLYKSFKGKQWQRLTLLTAFLYPGVCFAGFILFDLILASTGSTAAVPVLSLVALLALWFGISVPLVFLGAYIGFRKESIEFPVKTSNIPRSIPDQPWYMSMPLSIIIGGVLPFGACFVELFFILSSVFMDQYYYVFGFTLLVFIILLVTCAEITMVLVYFQLCSEDYRWWWRSFLTSGATAIYVFLYSAFYFAKLEANETITYVIYFGYMGMVCLGLLLLTGAVGHYSALWFTVTIFASIKVD
jgi:transmembrane 9 superfamily protein 2/4